jgi:adenosine deaminase
MFNTSLADEYRLLVQNCGFSKQEIGKIILLGIGSSWLSEEKKKSLVKKFEQDTAWKSIMG